MKKAASVQEVFGLVEETLGPDSRLTTIFKQCFLNTLEQTIDVLPDESVFVVTGDIPAMWLRDSAAQFGPYLVMEDEKIISLVRGIIRRQFYYINHDPYANAFNKEPSGQRYHDDVTEMTPLIWERKYEVDSLCYPLQLSYLYWKNTGRIDVFDDSFISAVEKILEVWTTEQNHAEDSPYTFQRFDCVPSDTLTHEGKGSPVGYTGMTWSGFRPSDDACQYGYLVPSNMFAVVVLGYLDEIARQVLGNAELSAKALKLQGEIRGGIEKFAKVEHPEYGTIYAYETDGLGNFNLMDDANVPSLLSVPYLGYTSLDDPIYQNTRSFVLSPANPYYYSGKCGSGIGSPHTPPRYIWHIALAIQGLTAQSQSEKLEILELMAKTDGGTGFMHEGFLVDDANQYTREWFSWANSMYCELVLDYCGLKVQR